MEKSMKRAEERQRERHVIWNAFASFCITPKMQAAVLTYYETPENALSAGETEWNTFFRLAEQFGFTKTEKAKIKEVLQRDHNKAYDTVEKAGIGFVTQEDEAYPEKLRKLFCAPRFFYYKGVLPAKEPMIAIVGARNCSLYGSNTAYRIAKDLAEQGVGVISGLAYGVDKAAHDGALAGGGATYGILGCGVDVCYPKSHREAYERILTTGGGILSEYPPGTQPLPCFFPQRNRIIAGLSDGVLVTEARKKSGSLITVSFGLEFGKNIYAVPGRIEDALSEGCNYLLKEGAKPVVSAADILEDITGRKTRRRKTGEENNPGLTGKEKEVYRHLSLHLKHVNELLEETGTEYAELVAILDGLVRKGSIKRHGQAYYALEGKS